MHTPLQRRLLGHLARQAVADPERPIGADELIAVGWPEERMMAHSARNRLHVALHRLRRSGLGAALIAGPGGWRLDRQVAVALAAPGD